MATPKKRKSLTRRKRSRAHHAKTLPKIVKCSNCSSYKQPHNICITCGYYNGELIKVPKIKKSENQ